MLPDEELLAMLVENGQRTDLDPIEEARAYRQLADMGLTHTDIGRRVGRHSNTVAARLALLQLSPDEQEDVRAGALSVSHVLGRAAAARQQERLRAGGRGRGRPKGAKTAPYFGDTHPLAQTVRAACEHRGRPKLGRVACGQCWEAVIRADAVDAALAPFDPTDAAESRDAS
jgi:ParB family chromosome partitioning protein